MNYTLPVMKDRPDVMPSAEEMNAEYAAVQKEIERLTDRAQELKAMHLWHTHPEVKQGTWVHPLKPDGTPNFQATYAVHGIDYWGHGLYGFRCVKVRKGVVDIAGHWEIFRSVAVSKKQPTQHPST